MGQAQIPRFDRAIAHLPRVHSSPNGDVLMGAFLPSDMTYAGKQRKAIRENFEHFASMQDRVRRAIDERSPLASPTPLPGSI